MAAPVLLIPTDATWTSELAARTALKTGDAYWKVEIDEGAGFVDRTSKLANNTLSIQASGSVFKAAEAAQAQFVLRNSPKVWSEGALANRPVRISAKIGAAGYIVVFTGYVSEQGAERKKGSLTDDTISLTAFDPSRYRGLRRRVPSAALLNYKVCNTTTPATSLAHYLATAMGLATPGDLEFWNLDYTKDYLGLDGQRRAWDELQDLALQYGALLCFRYDGDLRLAVWTAAEWNSPTAEYVFNDANVHGFSAVGGELFCNRARTEWSKYQALPAGSIIYKNFDDWDNAYQRNAIVVAAGEYWPGGSDALAVGRLEYGFNGEKYPIGTGITTPTLGAVGSGSDIEYSGSGLSIVSFNGSTSATQRNLNSSEIILRNTSGSPITIRKFQIRGTPLRELKKLLAEYKDAGVTNEWEEVEREIPGKYATTEAMAKVIVRRWVDFGKVARKRYRAVVDFTPHLQVGTLVTFNPTTDVNLICAVDSYRHVSGGPHTLTRTEIELTERVDFSATGAGSTETESPGDPPAPTGVLTVGASTWDGPCDVRCTGTSDEDTINAAIATGREVRLTKGVFVTDGQITCATADGIISGMGDETVIRKNGDYNGINVTADRVRVENLTATRNAGDTYDRSLVRVSGAGKVQVRNVHALDPYGSGIEFTDASAEFVCDTCRVSLVRGIGISATLNATGIISKCDISNGTLTPGANQVIGVIIQYTAKVTVTEGRIHDIQQPTNNIYGIASYNCNAGAGYNYGGIVLTKNTITDLVVACVSNQHLISCGIYLENSDEAMVDGNTIRSITKGDLDLDAGWRDGGIYVRGTSDRVVVQNNLVIGCTAHGISNESDTTVIKNNTCKGNGANLANLGDCEDSAVPPTIFGETATSLTGCTFADSTAVARSGSRSRRFTKTNAAGTSAQARLVDNTLTTDMHGLTRGQTYTFEAWIYVPSASGILGTEVQLAIRDYDASWAETTADGVNTYDAWQKITVTRRIRNNATGAGPFVQAKSTAAVNEYFNVDDIRISDTDPMQNGYRFGNCRMTKAGQIEGNSFQRNPILDLEWAGGTIIGRIIHARSIRVTATTDLRARTVIVDGDLTIDTGVTLTLQSLGNANVPGVPLLGGGLAGAASGGAGGGGMAAPNGGTNGYGGGGGGGGMAAGGNGGSGRDGGGAAVTGGAGGAGWPLGYGGAGGVGGNSLEGTNAYGGGGGGGAGAGGGGGAAQGGASRGPLTIFIVKGDIKNSGTITANGGSGSNYGGGGGGGGVVVIYCLGQSPSFGTIQANGGGGGRSTSGSPPHGAGGGGGGGHIELYGKTASFGTLSVTGGAAGTGGGGAAAGSAGTTETIDLSAPTTEGLGGKFNNANAGWWTPWVEGMRDGVLS